MQSHSNSDANSSDTAAVRGATWSHSFRIANSRTWRARAWGWRLNSNAAAGGINTVPNCSRTKSKRSTMARLESGEVLLTTTIPEVSVQIDYRILSGNTALGQFRPQSVAVQLGQTSRRPKGEPAFSVKPAGQLDLHVTLAFARTKRETRQCVVVKIECDAHARYFARETKGVMRDLPAVVRLISEALSEPPPEMEGAG